MKTLSSNVSPPPSPRRPDRTLAPQATLAEAPAGKSARLEDVTIRYHGQTIIERLSLEIAGGEFVVLLGPSGSGKSTLLGAIAGLTPVAAGRIHVGEREITGLAPGARRVGMVFQSYALYPHMTVRKNLAFALSSAGVDRRTVERKVAEACRILQLEGLEDRRPGALSGGQRQRVAIGRALVRDVDVLLFDEPLSNLDAKMRGELRTEIRQLHQRLGWTMIYVTHDQVEAMTLADRVVVMRAGRIEQIAPPREIYERPANLFVAGFVGSPAMNLLPAELSVGAGRVELGFDGRRLDLSAYAFAAPPAEGRREVLVGVRAEDLRIGDGGALPATVVACELIGPETLVWLDAKEQRLAARVPNDRILQPGAQVDVGFSVERLSLFDPATERRL